MEGGTTDYGGIGEDEMAEMQKLSNDYQPEVSVSGDILYIRHQVEKDFG